MTLDQALEQLHGVKKQGSGFLSHCPAHDDKKQSLSVTEKDGKLLMHCHAGCAFEDILSAMGSVPSSVQDLGRKSHTVRDSWTASKKVSHRDTKVVARYDYTDEDGKLLYYVERTDHKDFWQKKPDGTAIGTTRRVLYKLPEVMKAETIFIVEGEKDVATLNTLGLTATTVSGGANVSNWKPGFAQFFKDKRVVLLPDNDAPGLKFMRHIAKEVVKVTSRVKIVELPDVAEKGDVSDWIVAGHTKGELLKVVSNAATYEEGDRAIIVNLKDVKSEQVEWLWQDRIPVGKLTLIEGDPGVGKSWVTMALVAAVTTGAPLPNDTRKREPADALILSAEDGLGDTIRPRLDQMGADIDRVKILDGVQSGEKERSFSIVDDIKVMEKVLSRSSYGIVIVDPLNAYLGGIDSHKDTELRSALMPLAKVAERFKVGMACVRHLTKGSKDRAIYRGQGSIGYTAAARVVHLVGIDPNDATKRAIIPIKNNLATLVDGIEYSISDNGFMWGNNTTLTADQLLLPSDENLATLALDEAKEFILTKLEEDGRCEAREMYRDAKAVGISDRTLNRAKSELTLATLVETTKEGFGKAGRWVWMLSENPKIAKDSHVVGAGNLNENPNLLQDVKEVFGTDLKEPL